MTVWVEILTDMLNKKMISADKGLKNAVVQGLITAADYKTITGQDYAAPAGT